MMPESAAAPISDSPSASAVHRHAADLVRIYDLPSKGRRIPAMEGVRGLAVVLVFLVHFDQLIASLLPNHSLSRNILHWAGEMGHSGVDLFFLLSGYLIYGLVRSGKRSVPDFLARRVQRIYPTFFVILASYIVYMLLVPSQSKIPHATGAALLYLAANAMLLPGLFAITPIITVAWSLSYEVFYYAALPALYLVARMRRWNRTARVTFFVGLALAYCAYSVKYWNAAVPGILLNPGQHVRLIMFVAGILVYEVVSAKALRFRISRRREFAVALLAGCVVLGIPGLPSGTPAAVPALMLFVAFGLVCACSLGDETGLLATAFSFTPLRCLGNMSYSYYLIHAVGVHLTRGAMVRAFPISPALVWSVLPVCFAITWLASTALFLLVEKPLSFARPAISSRLDPVPTPETT
jgi:peptidoglycan/LPS O-acetylase OafA/YrhL